MADIAVPAVVPTLHATGSSYSVFQYTVVRNGREDKLRPWTEAVCSAAAAAAAAGPAGEEAWMGGPAAAVRCYVHTVPCRHT